MVKDALAFAGPFSFLAVRFALASLVMLPLVFSPRARARGLLTASLWRSGAVLGLLLCAGYGFQTAGLQFTTPARAAFITGLSVVIVPLLTSLVLRRGRLPTGVWLGVALAALGLALLAFGPTGQDLRALVAGTGPGDLLVLGCAVAFAAHIVAVGELAPRHPVLGLTWTQLLVAALLAAGLAAAGERPRLDQLVAILPAAAFTGVFATVLAFAIQLRAQRLTSPTHTALIFSTEPVFGALFAFLLVGELFTAPALLGCGCILAGMLLAQLADLTARGD
jgi:drug/metabolite transporter (DMT)-like permease